MRTILISAATAVILLLSSLVNSMAADRILTADEVKKLIAGNTVHVTLVSNGKQWKIFFAPDGKGYESESEARGTWEVKDNGEHCASWATLKCARIADLGDGKYARLKSGGDIAVTWKIEAGKHL